MNAVPPADGVLARVRQAAQPEWLLVWAGLAALYLPTLYRLVTEVWNHEAQAHGPVMLGLALWLMARRWPDVAALRGHDRASSAGWPLLVLGMLVYVAGRSQQIMIFEAGSLPLVIAAVLLLKHGPRTLLALWFPVFFMAFMVPLPEPVVLMLTMPMKMAVSFVTEKLLYAVGYPVGRQGVILQIGPYQLLVADACAGLQTVLTLEAMGLFYLNLTNKNAPAVRNLLLALLIVPISFSANVIRVITLTLVTYYLGDEMGQGFLHQFAGLVLILSALMLILGVDGLLKAWLGRRERRRQGLLGEVARA